MSQDSGAISGREEQQEKEQETLHLADLSGAVLTYEDANGDTVEVHFDE